MFCSLLYPQRQEQGPAHSRHLISGSINEWLRGQRPLSGTTASSAKLFPFLLAPQSRVKGAQCVSSQVTLVPSEVGRRDPSVPVALPSSLVPPLRSPSPPRPLLSVLPGTAYKERHRDHLRGPVMEALSTVSASSSHGPGDSGQGPITRIREGRRHSRPILAPARPSLSVLPCVYRLLLPEQHGHTGQRTDRTEEGPIGKPLRPGGK